MTTEEGAAATGLPGGAEPHPSGSITHLVVLRGGEVSVLSGPKGNINAAEEPASGLYYRDARYLSRYELALGEVTPMLLDAHDEGESMSSILTNPDLQTASGRIASHALLIRRQRMADGALRESLTISNYSATAARFPLVISLDADFADIFEVRGIDRLSPKPPVKAAATANGLSFTYRGADGQVRRTTAAFNPPPSRVEPGAVIFDLELGSRETTTIDAAVHVHDEDDAQSFGTAYMELRNRQDAWLDTITWIETDDDRLNAMVRRCLLDVHALQGQMDGRPFLAAGVPWFDALFGRDCLIAGMEMLPFSADILRDALLGLAANQANSFDPARDAEPGKIAHEIRRGELANIGEVPFGRYYGSVDSTPLFVMAAGQYFAWTADKETIQILAPAIAAALAWCKRRMAADPRSLLTYHRRAAGGLEHQGWKDSGDAVPYPDGALAAPPIALVEVQAYVFAAYSAAAALVADAGLSLDVDANAEARAVCARLEKYFAHPQRGYAFALDGTGRQVTPAASNAGHALWAGAATHQAAVRVGRDLVSEELFSGWGVRTLGSNTNTYNPLGYHQGAVWPHDNALIVGGLRRYGLRSEAMLLGQAFLDAAVAFPERRIPELYSGDFRSLRSIPTPYPVASRPQAWSAASLPFVLATLLGIFPGPDCSIEVVDPMLPPQVGEVRVRNLRCSGTTASLTFRRHQGRVSVEVDELAGPGAVVLKGPRTAPP